MLGLYLRTARYYRPSQIAARLRLGVDSLLVRRSPWLRHHRYAVPVAPHINERATFFESVGYDSPAFDNQVWHWSETARLCEQGSFKQLNHTVNLGSPINWQAPGTTRLWRYNLHYFDYALDLALLAKRRKDEKVAALLGRLFSDWINANPISEGVGWHSYPLHDGFVIRIADPLNPLLRFRPFPYPDVADNFETRLPRVVNQYQGYPVIRHQVAGADELLVVTEVCESNGMFVNDFKKLLGAASVLYVGPARGTDARRVEAVGFGKKLPFGGADTVLGKAGGLPFRILTTAAILLLQRLYDRRKDQRSEGVCHCGASFQQSCTDQRPDSLTQDVRSADVCWTQGFRFTLSQRVSQFMLRQAGENANRIGSTVVTVDFHCKLTSRKPRCVIFPRRRILLFSASPGSVETGYSPRTDRNCRCVSACKRRSADRAARSG